MVVLQKTQLHNIFWCYSIPARFNKIISLRNVTYISSRNSAMISIMFQTVLRFGKISKSTKKDFTMNSNFSFFFPKTE